MPDQPAPTIQTDGLVQRDRLRDAARLLREAGAGGLTRADLRRGLGGVSLRTVDRALALLEEQGARFERLRSGHPPCLRYVLTKGPGWDEHVTPEDRLALGLASLMLTQSPACFLDDHLKTIETLVAGRMSARDQSLFETLQKVVQIHGGVEDSIEPGKVLEPILQALETGMELKLAYRPAGSSRAEARTVVPHCLTLDIFSGGSFLAVWDPRDRKPKHLRLCRILEASVGTRPGVILDLPAMTNAAKYQIGGWTCGEPPFPVRARIQGTHWIEHFREAPPSLPDFEASELEGVVEVRFQANHLNGAARWLLQFGALAEALEPRELRAHLKQQHLQAAAQYQD